MRAREAIEAEIKFFDDIEDILPKLTIELLLDIRDLLQPVTITLDKPIDLEFTHPD